jgi:ABC-type lipoprotein export system ATPase subunit
MRVNYFEIKNLKCSYNDGSKIVLEIDELNIPRGKVVFIVGQSGCGKSTILETLGLMNNTLVCDNTTKFVFTPSPVGAESEVDCTKIWEKKNSFLSAIRRDYFSFIFQDTNLMRNFSIYENAIIPKKIKGGNRGYADTIRQVGLEQILTESKQNVGELSGGQKQRLAFVRAFLPNFSILFGDEPTGNLDPENADKLMKIVAEEIHNSQGIAGQTSEGGQAPNDGRAVKTAIIVSHSPELSVKYADMIVKIHKHERDNGETFGVINSESIYVKNSDKWYSRNKEIVDTELQTIIKS